MSVCKFPYKRSHAISCFVTANSMTQLSHTDRGPLCERCFFFTTFWRIDTSFLSLQPIILAGWAPREGGYTVPTGVPLAIHY
jgi:hypothetical protein